MVDSADLTFELLQRMYADLADVKREQLSTAASLSATEQRFAVMASDLGKIRRRIGGIRRYVANIRRRLDPV